MTINEYYAICESILKNPVYTAIGERVRGRRNEAEARDILVKQAICKATKATVPHIGMYCFRRILHNFGTKRFPDFRRMNDCFKIAKITDKMVIGINGERCLKTDIIRVFKEG